jgi:hypothetical protein
MSLADPIGGPPGRWIVMFQSQTPPRVLERCGSPPETTVHFNVRRLPGEGLISPDF